VTITHMLFGIEGRIRRSEYWACILASGGAFFVAILLVGFIANQVGELSDAMKVANGIFWLVVFGAYQWISICVQAKRCHDRDKSGWFQLIGFIPFIGGIWLLIELGFLDGTQGENRFGPSPKGISNVSDAFA